MPALQTTIISVRVDLRYPDVHTLSDPQLHRMEDAAGELLMEHLRLFLQQKIRTHAALRRARVAITELP